MGNTSLLPCVYKLTEFLLITYSMNTCIEVLSTRSIHYVSGDGILSLPFVFTHLIYMYPYLSSVAAEWA